MKRIEEFFKVLIYPAFIYLNIDMEIVGILCTLMVLDTIVGGVKSIRIQRSFDVRTMLWGIILKILMLIIPITVALMGKGIGYDLLIFVSTVIRIMIVSECYSILGNIYAAKNRVDVSKLDAISMMLKSIRKWLYVMIQSGLRKVEESNECGFKDRENKDIDQI